MPFELVNPQKRLLDDIADKSLNQRDVAATYRLALQVMGEVDWHTVNTAIIARWSEAGLRNVKKMAWK